MKAWNPSTRSYQAAPPMPEFVGRWRTPGGEDTRVRPSLVAQALSQIAHGAARAMSLIGSALDPTSREEDAAVDSPLSPLYGPFAVPMPSHLGYAQGESKRVVMPMSSGVNIRPGQPARIKSRPQVSAFRPERIVIGGDPNDWIISEIMIGRRSQLCDDGVLPGVVFSAYVDGLEVRLDAVATAQNFSMQVEYVGPNPEGEPFICSVTGSEASPIDLVPYGSDKEPTREALTNRIYLPLSSGVNLLPGARAVVTSRPQDPFRPERIVIGGNPESWVVSDIKVGNRSQFSQSGDIPGAVFSVSSKGTGLEFETVQTAMDFSILVTYIGDKKEGEPLLACALGSVPMLA